jgi:hypothetical protein
MHPSLVDKRVSKLTLYLKHMGIVKARPPAQQKSPHSHQQDYLQQDMSHAMMVC